jgi:hypothetical protein
MPIDPPVPQAVPAPNLESPFANEIPPTPPPDVAPLEVATLKVAPAAKTKTVRVTLQSGLEGATVILLTSRDFQETYTPTGFRSREEGSLEFDVQTEREWFLIYAYKPGVGHGFFHKYGKYAPEGPFEIKLGSSALLRIACVGTDGAPLKNLEVTVIGEIEISSAYDSQGNYLWSKRAGLPPRKALSNDKGRCEFEFLNRGWTPLQGWNARAGMEVDHHRRGARRRDRKEDRRHSGERSRNPL